MAEVVTLERGQSPPEKEDWIIVQKTPSGRHDLMASVDVHSKGATFRYQNAVDGEREIVIGRACAGADDHGVAKVYVYEADDA